jgi:hypothetical protein
LQCSIELIDAHPEPARDLLHCVEAAAVRAGDFQMSTTHV